MLTSTMFPNIHKMSRTQIVKNNHYFKIILGFLTFNSTILKRFFFQLVEGNHQT